MILALRNYKQYIYRGVFFNTEIFDLRSVSFTEPVLYDDAYDYEVYGYTKEELLDAGLKVKGDAIYIPKGLNFEMGYYPSVAFTATFKNDIELDFTELEDLEIEIKLNDDIKNAVEALIRKGVDADNLLYLILDEISNS